MRTGRGAGVQYRVEILSTSIIDSLRSSTFPAFWPIKNHPNNQVGSKVFESMADTGGGKEHIGRTESLASVAANIFATAGGDEINFIARVRILRIASAWRIDLDHQGAVFENGRKAFSFGIRKTNKRVGDCEQATRLFVIHVGVLKQKR